jgi:hypothetical protein
MPALTRKQINEQPERWQIHYAGVRVGLIQHAMAFNGTKWVNRHSSLGKLQTSGGKTL